MAERKKNKKQQNWEARSFSNYGPNFKIDINSPQLGESGEIIYELYGVTNTNDQSVIGLSQSGLLNIYNDRDIQITAGYKNETEGVDIALQSFDGDITLTAMRNGSIRLRGRSIIIDAAEDIDITAGRNVTITAGSLIKLDAPSIDIPETGGILGSLLSSVGGTLVGTVFAGTPLASAVGLDLIQSVAGSAIGDSGGDILGGLF